LNALFLAPVLRFNYEACASKMDGLAAAMGLSSGSEVPDAFERLVIELGLPCRLRELGVVKEALAPLAQQAVEDHCSATNPRPLDIEAAQKLYADAW
ncbi:MAG TPA: iron-containing alcohol dehydrogenase, partial [Ramlibacter sp.]|nr:iron-containing alcohol dehydrogenase [Ramlibacter sp.]